MATEIRSDKKALFDYIAVVHGPILAERMWHHAEVVAIDTARRFLSLGVGSPRQPLAKAKGLVWELCSGHVVLGDRARFDEMWARVELACGYRRDDRNCLQKALGAMGLMR